MQRAEHAAAPPPRPSIDRNAKSSPSLRRSKSVTATYPTSLAARRSRPKAESMITPEEYAALPPLIQKKYFSPKERICIAQQAAAQSRTKQRGKLGSWFSSVSAVELLSTRPSTSAGLPSNEPKPKSHNSKLSLVSFDDDPVSEEDARWFLSLPEKVKSKRFSREELVSLTARSHRALEIFSTSNECDPSSWRRSVHRLEAGACSPTESSLSSLDRSSSAALDCDDLEIASHSTSDLENATVSASNPTPTSAKAEGVSSIVDSVHNRPPSASEPISETTSASAEAEMEILKLYLQRRSPKNESSDGNTKRPPPGSPPATPAQPSKKRVYRRLHMLTPLPLPPPVLAPPLGVQRGTPFSTSARLSRPFLNTDSLAADDEAGFHVRELELDDAALDETPNPVLQIEGQIFELPANEESPMVASDGFLDALPSSAISDNGTYNSDKDLDDTADVESVETVGPRTPSPHDYRDGTIHSGTGDPGIDLTGFQLDARSSSPSTYDRNSSTMATFGLKHIPIGSPAHVVRTSSEEILYAYQRRLTSGVDVETSDPLALEVLPVSDDHTGAKGAFAISHQQDASRSSSKGLRRVLKSLQRR